MTTLRDRATDRLVVSSGIDRTEPVSAVWDTAIHDGRNSAVAADVAIQAQKERELGRIQDVGCLERSDRLNNNVRVAQVLTLGVQIVRRGEVSCVCIREVSQVQIFDCQRDCEILFRWHGSKVCRCYKFGRRHFVFTTNLPHGNSVT